MRPVRPALPRRLGGGPYERDAEPPAALVGAEGHVPQEGVRAAVTDDLSLADEPVAAARGDRRQAADGRRRASTGPTSVSGGRAGKRGGSGRLDGGEPGTRRRAAARRR
ncbi:hypothetical protein GCM10017752_45530 [Streptomyces roseoviridis]